MSDDKIILETHNYKWVDQAQREIEKIKAKCDFAWIKGVEHFGSTAIFGISAKPVLDIVIGVDDLKQAQELVPILQAMNYVFWHDNPKKDRLFFVKNMPPYGEKRTHHIHVFETSHYEWYARRLFRDYLNKHPDIATEYENLKLNLATKYSDDRESYTEAKTDFIRNTMQEAIAPYISFEPLQIDHLPLLHRWLNNPHVAAWRGNDYADLQKVKDKYSSYIDGYKIENSIQKPIYSYVIKIWQQCVGYIQYYKADDFMRDGYSLKDIKNLSHNLAAIDFYIGEESFTGKGLGSVILNKFLPKFVDPYYDKTIVDPNLLNKSAICSYEKSGFKQHKILANLNVVIMIR